VVLAIDNFKSRAMAIAAVPVDVDTSDAELESLYEEAAEKTRRVVERLGEVDGPKPLNLRAEPEDDPPFTSSMKRANFEKGVQRIREYVRAGDAFQVVLSQRLSVPLQASPFELYRGLRSLNPSPYLYFFELDGVSLVGSSPEVLVRVEDDVVTVRPIAGTRPRGKTPEEERALADDLLSDEKELAEHRMLVDLGRNDVGRVAQYGSVTVPDLMVVEKYSHVMHIVSQVEGRLREGLGAIDVFKACFPAGTVSGAPKVRAMEIIDELETTRRGPYAGAVGYFNYGGMSMDTAITIRTVLAKDGRAYVQAGAGIVADSDPDKEYEETLNKARALLKAAAMVGR
ncbi:MAG: anthranilate synthase component I, partial [Gemmatimonadales bacterium]|nr:anthranilate synthase component I [Gemmatimonadales bacterium]